jgi:hypothetical protein
LLPEEVLDYARKLRHKRLLEKISQGKGLSPSEYRELEEYENMTSKQKKGSEGRYWQAQGIVSA